MKKVNYGKYNLLDTAS